MSNEYATTAELKAQLGGTITDTVDDVTLGIANEAAARAVDAWCGRRFYKDATATARLYRPPDDRTVLDVQDFWDSTTLIVETDENNDATFETTWAAADYQLEPLNAAALGRPYRQIVASYTRIWPVCGVRATVRITAKWGWTAVPADVKQASLIEAARIWKRRYSPEGVLGGFSDFGPVRVSRFDDPEVLRLLGPFRLGGEFVGPSSLRIR